MQQEVDAFKSQEKSIKRVISERKTDSMKRESDCKKTPPNTSAPSSSDIYSWDDIVDVLRSPRAREYRDGSGIYEVDGAPEGFFVISSALSSEEQILWASIALEKYSTVEHTNVLNLKRLQRENASFPKNITEEHRQKLSEIFTNSSQSSETRDDDEDRFLWIASVSENNGLQMFQQKMRWASLGYHYDWTSRRYYKDVRTVFPTELSALCQR